MAKYKELCEIFEKIEKQYIMNFGNDAISNFTITIPDDAQPGGYYVGLIYYAENTNQRDDTDIGISNSIAALIFITVSGDIQDDGTLIDFTTDKTLYEFTPINFSVRYQNKGNIHSAVGGNIFIYKDDPRDPVEIITFNESASLTLPDHIRTYKEIWNDGFITFKDNKIQFNKSQFPKIHFGKYNALLKLKHPNENTRITSEHSLSFWIIPWRLTLMVFIFIFACVSIVRLSKKRRKRHDTDKSTQ